ncbi:nucleolysin tiar [Hordeum vulgare]|nr:nucleolysin tiar [Hordeum vulgare]
MEAEAQAEAARDASAPILKMKNDHMAYLVSATQKMERNIADILLNQESLERIVETKFHDLDNKVIEQTIIVNALKHEVDAVPLPISDDDNPTLPVTAQFMTQARSAIVAAPEMRPLVSALALTSTIPPSAPPVSTPLAQRTFAEASSDVLL